MGSQYIMEQPYLLFTPCEKDIVFTPEWLAKDIIKFFKPRPGETVLDPCRGGGAFYNQFPDYCINYWCEASEGKDFYQWVDPVDWIISNPPYSSLLAWVRHSFQVADNIVYLIPTHRIYGSYSFMRDLNSWGGIRTVYVIGTGTDAGFRFGHSLSAVYFKKDYTGGQYWVFRSRKERGDPIEK